MKEKNRRKSKDRIEIKKRIGQTQNKTDFLLEQFQMQRGLSYHQGLSLTCRLDITFFFYKYKDTFYLLEFCDFLLSYYYHLDILYRTGKIVKSSNKIFKN